MSPDFLIGRKARTIDVHKKTRCTMIIRLRTFAMPFPGWRRLWWKKLHTGHRRNTCRAGSCVACPHSALRIPQRTGHNSGVVSLTDDFQAYGDSLDHGRLPSLIRFNANTLWHLDAESRRRPQHQRRTLEHASEEHEPEMSNLNAVSASSRIACSTCSCSRPRSVFSSSIS